MREIKFRAWDNVRNKMWEWNMVSRDIDLGNILSGKSKLKPLQCTGLKDKNGVEIYEGDICEVVTSNDTYQYSESKNIYEVGNSRYAYRFFRNNKKHSLELAKAVTVEVIGNIYENPELLEGN